MRLDRIGLYNYRCFQHLELDLNESLDVIVGINGAGKSTILDGLAVSLGTFISGFDGIDSGARIRNKDARLASYEMGENDDVQNIYPVDVYATGTIDGRGVSWKRSLNHSKGMMTTKDAKDILNIAKVYQERLRQGDKSIILPIIAYYGTGRLWDYHREKKYDTFKNNNKTNGYIDCLCGSANIKLMMNWFRKKTIQLSQNKQYEILPRGEQLETVYHAMAKCFARVAQVDDVSMYYNLDTNEIDCFYRDSNGLIMRVPISQLSDGYKSTISLIADIAYRMAVLNPQLGSSVLEETHGVVLIDEIDLHLHPEWQHTVISDLRRIFPKVQFIVSTHAPAVISSVRSEHLIMLKNNQAFYGGTETYGKDANSLLKEIMGTTERNPEVAKLFDQYYIAMSKKEFDEAESLLDRIDRIRGYHDQEVVANRVKLKMERIRGRISD